MIEGEACVVAVSNVGEMESEKNQQKRDYRWVNDGDSDVEPVAKKQVKESSVEDEADGDRLSIEGLDVIKTQACVEEDVKDSLDGLELVPCGRRQTEDLNGNMADSSDGESVQQCLKGSSQQMCDIEQVAECLDCVPIERSVKEGSCDMELETSGEKHSSEVLYGMELEPVIEQPVKEYLNEIVQESHFRLQRTEVESGVEAEPSIEQPVEKYSNEMETDACGKIQQTEALNETEPEPSVQQPVIECLDGVELEVDEKKQTTESMNNTGVQPFVINQAPHALNGTELEISVDQSIKECQNEVVIDTCTKEAFNETEPEPSVQQPVKECLDDMELEVDEKKQTTESMNDTGIQPSVINQTTHALNDTKLDISADQSIEECQNEVVIDVCTKEAKEASNDDICSEVSNPNVSPRDNSSSFQTVNSQPDGKLVMKDQVVCGEITSACSGNSSCEASSSHEEHGTNDMVSTSHVVIEVPKHASTSSGIRKITFKFSKRKEDYDNQLSASALKCTSSAFVNGIRKIHRLPHISEQGLHNPGDSLQHPTNMESINGNVVPDGYPTTVKRLLSTGILDGAKVTYVSASQGELIGIIKDCGYLCGCATCNFAHVLCAQEFEEHAGGKTRHPNNHIYLENGKPIYSIIQAMKTAPLSMVDEVIKTVAGSSVNEELLQVWKGSLQRHMDRDKIDNSHHMKLMNLYHSTASHAREDGSSPYYGYSSFTSESQTIVNETLKERKCLFKKKPKSYTSSTAVKTKRCSEGGHKKRDNDLHRLLFMPNGLPDGTELAYYARGKKILDGYKQGNGIVCSHCDTEISPSQFEAHAGWAAKRQPYRHICIPNGLALHDIAMLLANGRSITTSNSDDMCAVCGDRGELVICDGCPRAFHAVCLGLEGVPSEDWHCPYCRDSVGSGRKAASEFRPIVIRLTRVVKAREYETGGCVICRAQDFSVAEFDDRTVMLCDQCEKEYHVGCLRESGRCDLKALPSDKWFCCNHCDMIHSTIQDVVVNGATVVSGSVLSTINKKHIEKGVFSGAPNEIRWRMLSGKSRFPEHLPLLSRAAAIFRECFDPIVAKSGRDLIPVMVYGRNISGQEFGGIYCVVLMAGPIVVSAGLLRVFGREVAELPLVATSRQHQGKGYFQALFFSIEELLLSLGVQLLVLPAAEEAESIWTKKLGFRKMSDERYSEYARDIQLTIFKGTSMLEKELKHAA